MKLAKLVLATGLASVVTAPAYAQGPGEMMPESYRAVQLSALQLQRRTLLAMADSMPEALYRDKATPVQRDFAQQIAHAAGTFPFALPRFMNAPAPQLPDTAAYLNSRAGLRSFVNACYDYAERVLREQTGAQRSEVIQMFSVRIPRWQVWDELHQHTFWTAGQIVANFRKHGMAPPGFGFF
jgi:hypothetical protein